jgi:uncharacterized membrane protein YciS (DUF1049 family)
MLWILAAKSTNTRVLVFSLFQIGVVVAVCIWQVYYFRAILETKRGGK